MTETITETTDKTPLGDRMKTYERTHRQVLPRRTYTLMRLDGRAFHTYLKGCTKPFDLDFVHDMNDLATHLCQEIQGVQFAYTQSDEISLLLTDFATLNSEPWVRGRVDKMVSLSASLAGAFFTRLRWEWPKLATFDSRVWTMSDPVEVANYFLWRQWDAETNSLQMLAQHYFSVAELHGKKNGQLQDMLYLKHKVNWNNLDPGLKRGRIIYPMDKTDPDLPQAGARWVVEAAPHFIAGPGNWLAYRIPVLPSLRGGCST